jgi:hypothetical protein
MIAIVRRMSRISKSLPFVSAALVSGCALSATDGQAPGEVVAEEKQAMRKDPGDQCIFFCCDATGTTCRDFSGANCGPGPTPFLKCLPPGTGTTGTGGGYLP